MRARSAFVLLALLALPRAGLAAEPVVLLLGDNVSAQIPTPMRDAALRAVAASLGQLAGVKVVRPASPEVRLNARLERLFAAARTHSEHFEEKQALVKLAEAEQAFRDAFGRVPSVEPLARMLLARVRVLAELQRDDDLRQDLARLLALDPSRSFDRAQYPPKVVKLWKRLQAREGKRRATLSISTVPPGLSVLVDGARRGTAPVEVSLPPGEHFVAAGGSGTWTVLGKEGGEVTLKAAQLPDERWRAEAREAKASWALLCELEPVAGGSFLLRLRLLSASNVATPRALSSRPIAPQGLEGASASLCAQLPALLGRAAPPPPPPEPPPEPTDPGPPAWLVAKPRPAPVWKRWWFWTALGAAVAGGVTAAVLLTRERETQIHLLVER